MVLHTIFSYVSYQLPTGVYSRLRAVVGADVGDPSAMTAEDKRNVMFVMAIEGDGRELFRSEPFLWDSPPVEIDLDIAGVKTLRLSVVNRSREVYKKLSINWADLRIER